MTFFFLLIFIFYPSQHEILNPPLVTLLVKEHLSGNFAMKKAKVEPFWQFFLSFMRIARKAAKKSGREKVSAGLTRELRP